MKLAVVLLTLTWGLLPAIVLGDELARSRNGR